ncbi:MAG: pyrroloquinoline quinone (PQQ) biosynthesis protein C [Candidatus Azotimanducaceae bacterium]|jgi:pyrroloquinoline quinone (PQQ) biosynthesis protein C
MDFLEANGIAISSMVERVDRFPFENAEAYANWLAQVYHYASQTVSLLSWLVSRTDIRTHPELHNSRTVHTDEEKGHDQWLSNDIEALGFDLKSMEELPSTRMLWEPQFSVRKSVEAVYGYTIVLEQLAVLRGSKVASRVENLSTKNCNTFLKGHSDSDVGHVKRDLEVINNFEPSSRFAVINNMMQSAEAYNNMLDSIERRVS